MSCPFECHCWPHSAAQLPRHAMGCKQQEQHSTFKKHVKTGNHPMMYLFLYNEYQEKTYATSVPASTPLASRGRRRLAKKAMAAS